MDALSTLALLRLAAWALIAFALWLALGSVFAWLQLPAPQLGAAVLGWVMAGLVLPWLLQPAVHFGRHVAEVAALVLGNR